MPLPRAWAGVAHNPVPHSENRIHSDAVARQYGFRGGLVPGVCVAGLLLQPAVEAWGLDWLARGRARVGVRRPLYDGDAFRVALEDADAARYRATLHAGDGATLADAEVELPDGPGPPPRRRGDATAGPDPVRPRASRAAFERLRRDGMLAARFRWGEQVEIASYLRDPEEMPELLRPSGSRYAHPAFVLGMTNWALARNVVLDPWLHLETWHQNHAPVPWGSELVVEQEVADLFRKKDYEFVDVDVAAFLSDATPVLSARLRAIYELRAD